MRFFDPMFFLIAAGISPLDIATGAEKGGQITLQTEGENTIMELFQLANLFAMLKRDGMIWAAIVIVVLIISMFFIKRSDKLSDRKDDILHKLLIVFLMASVLFLLSAVVTMLDKLF